MELLASIRVGFVFSSAALWHFAAAAAALLLPRLLLRRQFALSHFAPAAWHGLPRLAPAWTLATFAPFVIVRKRRPPSPFAIFDRLRCYLSVRFWCFLTLGPIQVSPAIARWFWMVCGRRCRCAVALLPSQPQRRRPVGSCSGALMCFAILFIHAKHLS